MELSDRLRTDENCMSSPLVAVAISKNLNLATIFSQNSHRTFFFKIAICAGKGGGD